MKIRNFTHQTLNDDIMSGKMPLHIVYIRYTHYQYIVTNSV